jgi:Uma2 family endonuclease
MNQLETNNAIVTEVPPFPFIEVEAEQLPELENGDRLKRAEFERRFDAMPDLKQAELIKGVVYMASPVRRKKHGKPHLLITTWIGSYLAATPGTDAADNASVRVDEDNMPQPDVDLRIEEECSGQSYVDEDDYLQNVPELVVEVASSTASYDLHDKLEMYLLHGAKEYLVWRVLDKEIDWFVSQAGTYSKLQPDAEGIIASTIFPGLRLAVNAMLTGDMATVLAELQKGIASDEHQAFVAELAERRKANSQS